MSDINKIKQLREMTGAGMMDVKKALDATDYDMDEAVKWLRENGIAKAAKKADRVAAEGAIFVASNDSKAVVVEINSETDYVATNDQFNEAGQKIAEKVIEGGYNSLEELLAADMDGETVESFTTQLTATIGEKIQIRRFEIFDLSDKQVAIYKHSNSRIGTVVVGEGMEEETLKDIAMHAAAMYPTFLSMDEISDEKIAEETEMAKKDLADQLEGKPENVVEGMIKGKVNKTLAEGVLLEQTFVKDPSKKVKDLQGSGSIVAFARLEVGEGIEKKEENFAEEVAKQMAV